jgi:hypothetical protein
VGNASPVTRMLIRLNMVMRQFKNKGECLILYVIDRVPNRNDVVVLIVDIFAQHEEHAGKLAKKVLDHLGSYSIKVVDHRMKPYLMPDREVWRLVAMVAVER